MASISTTLGTPVLLNGGCRPYYVNVRLLTGSEFDRISFSHTFPVFINSCECKVILAIFVFVRNWV